MQRLQFIEAHKSNSLNLKSADHLLAKLFSNMQKVMDGEYQLARHQVIGVLVDVHSCGWTSCHNSGAGRTPCWISFDISMENAVDGKHLNAISCIEILAGNCNILIWRFISNDCPTLKTIWNLISHIISLPSAFTWLQN